MSQNLSKFDLQGKVALVTGGGGLLGLQHALALAECGAHVFVSDTNLAAAEKAAQQVRDAHGAESASALFLDVSKLESVRAGQAEILKAKSALHILVNNAAIDPKVSATAGLVESSRFEHFPLEQWDFQLAVGLTGAFLCSQIFGAWMASNGGGIILNIASDLSVIAPDQRLYRKSGLAEEQQPVKPVTYSVIKTGLIGLTRYLAGYWAAQGVRVNALSPGGVYTQQPEEFVQKLTNLIPMGRMARKDEYASAVQFLCSDASSYLTGQNIVMDGGRSVL
jgi:NAD(P)-dependent dehydrogenase (short-subunit alcohol dehydrogenase family)